MNDTGNTDVNNAVDSSTDAGVEGTAPKTVPVENRIAEVNRRLSKLERSIDDKLQTLLSNLQPAEKAVTYTQQETTSEAYMTKGEYYKQKDSEEYERIKAIYPELDKNSENFDEEFFKLADVYYQEFSNSKMPALRQKAVQKAVEQAAVETGKFQQLERSKALSDELRRSRLLGEGTTAPKAVQKDAASAIPENVKTLAKLFGIDDKRLKKEYK